MSFLKPLKPHLIFFFPSCISQFSRRCHLSSLVNSAWALVGITFPLDRGGWCLGVWTAKRPLQGVGELWVRAEHQLSPPRLMVGCQVPFQPGRALATPSELCLLASPTSPLCLPAQAAGRAAVVRAVCPSAHGAWEQGDAGLQLLLWKRQRSRLCRVPGIEAGKAAVNVLQTDRPGSPLAQPCFAPAARSAASTYPLQASYPASLPIHLLPAPSPALLP